MTSQINPNNIDGAYPVAGQDNNSQGFRDNFTNIKQNFQYAQTEISDLESKAVLKAALLGTVLDNNMNDNLLYAAKIQDFSATKISVVPQGAPVTATINYALGHYQTFATNSSTLLAFTNWPSNGNYGYVRLQISITNTAHTIDLPASVSLGLSGIQGISPGTSGLPNSITFGDIGTYEFAFSTYDSGTTITIFDLNRALVNFDTANIQTQGVTCTGNITAGGVVQGSTISSTGNVQAVNLIASGTLSVGAGATGAGNVSATNLNATNSVTGTVVAGRIRPTAGGTVATAAPLIFAAGNTVANIHTTIGGTLEYDGFTITSSPLPGTRGFIPSNSIRVSTVDYVLADTAVAQDVFDEPNGILYGEDTCLEFEAIYYITRVAGAASRTLSLSFDLTGTLASISYIADTTSTSSNVIGPVSRIYSTSALDTTVTAPSSATNENITVFLKGIMRVNLPGIITPRLRWSTVVGGPATLLSNSFFKLSPMGTTTMLGVGDWS